jgi:hypothetical protein
MFLEHTPIEEHKVGSTTVYVKREDLYGQPPMPPLAKLRGIRLVLDSLYYKGVRTIGVLDTRVSKSGQGVAAVRRYEHPDMRLMLAYPVSKANGSAPPQHTEAEKLGAELYPQQATRQSIMWYKFKRIVEEQGGVMLPHGLPFPETAISVAREAKTVPEELLQGSLVLIVGTGTILAGILLGLETMPKKIIGISAGKDTLGQYRTINNILKAIAPFTPLKTREVQLKQPIMDYSVADDYPCSFPSHPNYDRKAWHYLCEHINELPQPCLFWNIGA